MYSIKNLYCTLLFSAGLSSISLVTQAAAGILDSANMLYNNGRIVEAISLYRRAAGEGENPALCYFNMANAYFQLDSVPQSIVYYKACLGLAPNFFRAHLNIAIAYYSLDDIGECIAHIHRALQLEPTEQKALLICAAAYRRAGANPEAVATFEQLVQLYPDNEDAYIALAEIYRELNDADAATQWLLRYPRGGKNETYVNTMLADIFEERGDYTRAIYHLKLAFEKDKTAKWVYYRMVSLYLKEGNSLVALELAQKGLDIMPRFADLALLAGNIAFEQGRYDTAERLYQQARDNGSAGAVIGLENIRIVKSDGIKIK